MLTITGKNLGVSSQRVTPREGQTFEAFEKTICSLLVVSHGGAPRIEEVELGRDFQGADLLGGAEGEEVTLRIGMTTFRTRAGAGHRFTAYEVLPALAYAPAH